MHSEIVIPSGARDLGFRTYRGQECPRHKKVFQRSFFGRECRPDAVGAELTQASAGLSVRAVEQNYISGGIPPPPLFR
jgi:hypothetical protein